MLYTGWAEQLLCNLVVLLPIYDSIAVPALLVSSQSDEYVVLQVE